MPRPADDAIWGRDLRVVYGVTDGRHEDLDLDAEADVLTGHADALVADGLATVRQALVHRVKTVRGELAGLGHAAYGSRHHELIGQPNSEHNRNLVKLYVLQAVQEEPRVSRVLSAEIVAEPAPDRVAVHLSLEIIGSNVPMNLVVPFSFGGRL